MTTLFKKLTLSTLTLVIASGIVFSVGSSEPSTFEGQASGTQGIYSMNLNNTVNWNTTTGTSSVTKSTNEVATFTLQGAPVSTDYTYSNTNKLPIVENNASNQLTLDLDQVQEIRSITVTFTGAFAEFWFYNTVTNGNDVASTSYNTDAFTSGTIFYMNTVSTTGSYPDSFTFNLVGANATLTSMVITYDC